MQNAIKAQFGQARKLDDLRTPAHGQIQLFDCHRVKRKFTAKVAKRAKEDDGLLRVVCHCRWALSRARCILSSTPKTGPGLVPDLMLAFFLRALCDLRGEILTPARRPRTTSGISAGFARPDALSFALDYQSR